MEFFFNGGRETRQYLQTDYQKKEKKKGKEEKSFGMDKILAEQNIKQNLRAKMFQILKVILTEKRYRISSKGGGGIYHRNHSPLVSKHLPEFNATPTRHDYRDKMEE